MPCSVATPCGGVTREDPISSQVAGRPIRRCLNGHRVEAGPVDLTEDIDMAKDPAACGFCRLSKTGRCVRHLKDPTAPGPSAAPAPPLAPKKDPEVAVAPSARGLSLAEPRPPEAPPETLAGAIWKLLARRRDLAKELADVDGELAQLRSAIDEALHPEPRRPKRR